jgi:hypothetical protein
MKNPVPPSLYCCKHFQYTICAVQCPIPHTTYHCTGTKDKWRYFLKIYISISDYFSQQWVLGHFIWKAFYLNVPTNKWNPDLCLKTTTQPALLVQLVSRMYSGQFLLDGHVRRTGNQMPPHTSAKFGFVTSQWKDSHRLKNKPRRKTCLLASQSTAWPAAKQKTEACWLPVRRKIGLLTSNREAERPPGCQ